MAAQLQTPAQPALTGPVEESPGEEEHRLVDELQRHLGSSYAVRLVSRWPASELDSAARSLGMGVRVVLLPLSALPDSARARALLDSVEQVLDRRRKVARAPALTAQDGVVDVLTACTRTGLIDLDAEGPVPVLFAARMAAVPGRQGVHLAQLERLAQSVAREARLAGPAEVAFHGHGGPFGGPQPRVAKVLEEWAGEGADKALVVDLDGLSEAPDTTVALRRMLDKASLEVGLAPVPGARPLFVHCLASACHAAEQRAGWLDE